MNRNTNGRQQIIVYGRETDRGDTKYKDKLQVLRQDKRAKVKKLRKINIEGLLIKIGHSEKLQANVGVLN